MAGNTNVFTSTHDTSILHGMTDNYEVYDDANRFLGMTTVDLPDFNFLTNEVSGPGILGNLAIPAIGHTESLELTLNWRVITKEFIGFLAPHAYDLSLRISEHAYDIAPGKTKSIPTRIDFRGLSKNNSLGKIEKAAETESKSTFELITLQIYIDNTIYLDYDKLNYKLEINSTDYLDDFQSSVKMDSTSSSVASGDSDYKTEIPDKVSQLSSLKTTG